MQTPSISSINITFIMIALKLFPSHLDPHKAIVLHRSQYVQHVSTLTQLSLLPASHVPSKSIHLLLVSVSPFLVHFHPSASPVTSLLLNMNTTS